MNLSLDTIVRLNNIKHASRKLLWSTLFLMGILIALFVVLEMVGRVYVLLGVMGLGALGAVVSLVRRLKYLSEEDLKLICDSVPYSLLAQSSGAILAGVLYLLFISGLLTGSLFPKFQDAIESASGVSKLFLSECSSPADYAKLFFWSFVAGFSEKFVINILGKFEADSKEKTMDRG